MIKEFKKFIFKGNVFDLATGVIIGSAFGKIVTSLVNDIIMPALSIILGKINFSNLKYVITPENKVNNVAEVSIKYGLFIQNVVDFLIIGFCIFLMIKVVINFNKKENKKEENIKVPSDQEKLLLDIKNILTEIKNK